MHQTTDPPPPPKPKPTLPLLNLLLPPKWNADFTAADATNGGDQWAEQGRGEARLVSVWRRVTSRDASHVIARPDRSSSARRTTTVRPLSCRVIDSAAALAARARARARRRSALVRRARAPPEALPDPTRARTTDTLFFDDFQTPQSMTCHRVGTHSVWYGSFALFFFFGASPQVTTHPLRSDGGMNPLSLVEPPTVSEESLSNPTQPITQPPKNGRRCIHSLASSLGACTFTNVLRGVTVEPTKRTVSVGRSVVVVGGLASAQPAEHTRESVNTMRTQSADQVRSDDDIMMTHGGAR